MAKITINGRDIGFGTRRFQVDRLVNKDGTFNVAKKGSGYKGFSLYYLLINLHWFPFLLAIITAYLIINMAFGWVYYLLGAETLTGYTGTSTWEAFSHCFYFSAQTLTTVGYGMISPTSGSASFVAAIEAMFGLISFAFATGIFYGRFSKPKARISFSDKAVVSPYRGIKGLKFRTVNLRKNHLIDMEARLMYSYLDKENGETKRKYQTLSLEINFINMFAVPWTIVHPIDEESPIHGKTGEMFKAEEAEFIVIMKGFDDTFSQYVHQVYDYRFDEIEFDADFEPMYDPSSQGVTEIHVNRISHIKKV